MAQVALTGFAAHGHLHRSITRVAVRAKMGDMVVPERITEAMEQNLRRLWRPQFRCFWIGAVGTSLFACSGDRPEFPDRTESSNTADGTDQGVAPGSTSLNPAQDPSSTSGIGGGGGVSPANTTIAPGVSPTPNTPPTDVSDMTEPQSPPPADTTTDVVAPNPGEVAPNGSDSPGMGGNVAPDVNPTPDPTGNTVEPGTGPTPGVEPVDPTTDPLAPEPVDPGGPASGGCTFSIEDSLSSDISTVGIVNWSTDAALTSASIEFTPASGGDTLTAPVDVSAGGTFRTLLLGMKGDTTYDYRIVVNEGECASEARSITTGPVPSNVADVDIQQGQLTKGFYIVSTGLGSGGGFGGGGFGGGGGGGGGELAFIFDQDGDPVWWATAPGSTSRALMDYEGNYFYMMALNVGVGQNSLQAGQMRRVAMDGSGAQTVQELQYGHHDFTTAPGVVTAIVHTANCNAIVEYSPNGSVNTIVPDVSTLYAPSGECHANAITYQPDDDTYVISDRNPNLYVRIDRQGNLLWQLGGGNPKGPIFTGQGLTWSVNHGHHLYKDGGALKMLVFNNGSGQQSPVLSFTLDEGAMTAQRDWEYSSSDGSLVLGDVQRLLNGNTLITYSNTGILVEIDPSQNVAARVKIGGSLGYSMHRTSLYGPPDK